MTRSRWYAGLLVLVAVAAVGCGGGLHMSEVEGTVNIGGKPVDKIRVEFWPDAQGPRSVGTTDGQGRFTLSTESDAKKGALVGKHKVILTDVSIYGDKIMGREAAEMDLSQGKKPRIANQYNSPQSTPLTKEVEAGKKNEFSFDVEPTGG